MNRIIPRHARTIGPALALLLAARTASAQSGFTFQWICDNNWNDSCPTTIACPNPRTAWNTNWENANCSADGRRPTLADDVLISPMGASMYEVDVGYGGLCNSITTTPGSLLVIDGGALQFSITGWGSIAGNLLWGNGSMTAGGTGTVPVTITGDVTMYPPNNHTLSHVAVNSFGTVNWTGGNWTLSVSSGWTNHGTLDLIGTLTGTGAGGTLYNPGTIVRSSGTGLANLNMPVNNSGLVNTTVGTVHINDGTSSGTFYTSAGAELQFDYHTFTGSASFTGDGYARMVYGPVHMDGAITADNFEIAASLQGTGSLHVGTSLLWTSGEVRDMADLRVLGGSTNTWALQPGSHWFGTSTINLDPASETHWTLGSVTSSSATINAAPGSEFYADSPGGVLGQSVSAFNNAGAVYKTTSGTSEIRMAFNNTGDVHVGAGKLLLNSISGAASAGHWDVAPGATLGIKAGNSVPSAHVMGPGTLFTGDGLVSFEGGRSHLNEDVTFRGLEVSNSATVSGTGDITVGSSLHWMNGTIEGTSGTPDLTIGPGATMTADVSGGRTLRDRRLVNRGTVLWSDPTGGLGVASGTASIENYGVWNFAGIAGGINGGGGGAGFLNAAGAELVKSAGTGSTQISTPTLTNDGTIRVQSGKLTLTLTTLTQGATGSVVLENGAELYFGGAYFYTGPGALLGNGVVTAARVFNSGLVSPGAGATTGPLSLSGLYTQQAGSVLEIGIGAGGMADYSRVVAGNTVTINGGTLVVNEAGYTPVAGDTFEVLRGTSLSGTFPAPWYRSVQYPKYKYIYTYTPTSVVLQVSCPADFNGDGYVNGDDADAYNAEFYLGTGAADFNGDGFTTGDDFDEFSVAFEAGC